MANEKKTGVQIASETMTENGIMPDVASPESLKRFATATKRMGRNLNTNGITAKDILRLSRNIDIKRANSEIHWAIPLSMRNWVMSIKTQASTKYGATKHDVKVQFLDYKSAVVQTGVKKPLQLAKEVATGKIKYDCDCGRHRYWYRFIADTGGWAFGVKETRFPKIRNPRLTGIACKHIVRVAKELESSRAIHNMIAKFLKAPIETTTSKSNEERIKKRMLENRKHIIRAKRDKMVEKKTITKLLKKPTDKPKKPSEQEILKQALKLAKAGQTKDAMALLTALAKQQGKL